MTKHMRARRSIRRGNIFSRQSCYVSSIDFWNKDKEMVVWFRQSRHDDSKNMDRDLALWTHAKQTVGTVFFRLCDACSGANIGSLGGPGLDLGLSTERKEGCH